MGRGLFLTDPWTSHMLLHIQAVRGLGLNSTPSTRQLRQTTATQSEASDPKCRRRIARVCVRMYDIFRRVSGAN